MLFLQLILNPMLYLSVQIRPEKWKDTRLAFNLQEPTTDTKIYKLGEIWDPYLIGVNTIDRRHSFNDSLTVKPDGTVQTDQLAHLELKPTPLDN